MFLYLLGFVCLVMFVICMFLVSLLFVACFLLFVVWLCVCCVCVCVVVCFLCLLLLLCLTIYTDNPIHILLNAMSAWGCTVDESFFSCQPCDKKGSGRYAPNEGVCYSLFESFVAILVDFLLDCYV
jgi:hypothetical protein